MINNEFVLYEEALKLKQLGFNEPCFKVYTSSNFPNDEDFNQLWWPDSVFDISRTQEVDNTWVTNDKSCTAPTYRAVFKWIRDTFKLDSLVVGCEKIQVEGGTKGGYDYCISKQSQVKVGTLSNYDTHEEAELTCLRNLLDIIVRDKDKPATTCGLSEESNKEI